MDRTELYRVSTQILENIINDEKNDNNILFDMDIWDWSQISISNRMLLSESMVTC